MPNEEFVKSQLRRILAGGSFSDGDKEILIKAIVEAVKMALSRE